MSFLICLQFVFSVFASQFLLYFLVLFLSRFFGISYFSASRFVFLPAVFFGYFIFFNFSKN
jgi:hypothetical protein